MLINTLRPRQNGCHFADHIFKCIFLNENIWISLTISLKFVPEVPVNNIPSLFQIMACCRTGNKPLSEPMVVSLLMQICITWPQWVKTELPSKASLCIILWRCVWAMLPTSHRVMKPCRVSYSVSFLLHCIHIYTRNNERSISPDRKYRQ